MLLQVLVYITYFAVIEIAALPQYYHFGDHQGGDLHVKYKEDYYDPHPKYTFEYGVHDSHTGDIKSHKEERDGDVVQGSYQLVEAGGHRRVVHYTASHDGGFSATVHREPSWHPVHNDPYHDFY